MSQSLSEQLSRIPRWKYVYTLVLLFCWVVAAIFQIGNPGWFLILLGLIYCFVFPLHLVFWGFTIARRTAVTKWTNLSFFGNNLLFLFANVLNVDFGDVNSYMFFMQYEDPPEIFLTIGFGLYVLWFITLMIDLVIRVVHYYNNRNNEKEPIEA